MLWLLDLYVVSPGQEGCWRNEKQRLLSCWPEPTGVLAPLKVTCVPCFLCFQKDHQQSLCPDLPDLLVPWVPQDLQGRQVNLFSYFSPNQQQAVDTMDSRHICSNPDTEGRDYGEKARAYKGGAQCCTRHLLRHRDPEWVNYSPKVTQPTKGRGGFPSRLFCLQNRSS